MARATTRTLLPLDRFAELLGIDPLHFNQITTTKRRTATCASVWKQFAWQESSQVGREDVAEAIQEAENRIAAQIGYKLLPTWEVDERLGAPRPGIAELFMAEPRDLRGFPSSIQTKYGHFIAGGVERKSLIESGVTIVFSDEDLDGWFETATITTAVDYDADGLPITSGSEVSVYFPNESGAEEWEIRPIRSVVITGGTITITMWRHQLVDPALQSVLSPIAVPGDVDTNFVTEVDVYHHYDDPQTQVEMMWSPGVGLCDCGGGTCPTCAHSVQWGCLVAHDYRRGIIRYSPSEWNAVYKEFNSASLSVGRAPDHLRLWYYAGHRDMTRPWPNLQMDRTLERAVAYYSLALLDRPLCGCDNVERAMRKWSEDLALNQGNPTGTVSYQLSPRAIGNPFGMERGALFAWETVMAGALGKSVRY